MKLKKMMSVCLAMAVMVNTGSISAMAQSSGAKTAETDQIVSAPETVYVNAYDAGERSVSFNDHWRFYLGELNGAEAPVYNDASWKDVTLPHDYSIDQGYSTAAPAEQESGYVLGGIGWYRKTFMLSEEMQGKNVSVDFDGVYMNASVYLNGTKLGMHPYGYTPFSFVLPEELLHFGSEENVLAVKVEHKQPSSRWYSGSGIYRDVKLTVTEPVHVSHFGTAVTTPDIEKGTGTVNIVTTVRNDSGGEAQVSVKQTVYEKGKNTPAAQGQQTAAQAVAAGKEAGIAASVTVADPKLWTTETPNLYTVHTEVYADGTLTDEYDTEFGFRWVKFTKDNGFFLNGKNIKLKGVSMHHDQGGLGSEAWYRATERQVEKLKEMGANAIRVTHNPASQALIDICNEKGMMLVEEAFDCWLSGKAGNTEDFGKWFEVKIGADNQIVDKKTDETWAEFDLKAMVKRGKNAPSIIMWSLGNEVFQQLIDSSQNSRYPDIAEQLIRWTAEEDATRYVTFGDNWFKGNESNSSNLATQTAKVFARANEFGVPGGLPGYNYGGSGQIQNGHNQGWMVYGSETASSTNSRGVYDRKVSNGDGNKGDRRLTSYDKSCVGWGHLASEALYITLCQPFNAGEFAWTGFDYIGEPTPYNEQGPGANGTWPNIAKSSYFGIIDTAGFPKDSFYLYQSQWNDSVNTLHVLPVWNRNEIMVDGSGKVEVVVYSDAPVIKLYLNGTEIGTAKAERTDTATGGYQNYTTGTGCFDTSKASKVGTDSYTSLYATFNVSYEEGKLEAKAFEADGTTPVTKTEGRSVVETTKGASRLSAEADRKTITADGKDLSYITIDVTDADGKFVNGAEPEITVSVEGEGILLALDNGVQNDVTPHGEAARKAGKGKLLAIVQSTKKAGSFKVKAQAEGYEAAEVTVTTEAKEETPVKKSVESYEISRNYYIKKGASPTLPGTVKVHYTDKTEETKTVAWEALPTNPDTMYTVYGTIAGTGLKIPAYVTTLEKAAAVMNYSAAVGKGAGISLPASRPAVKADGELLPVEIPVTWNMPAGDVTAETGMKKIKGEADLFGDHFEVSASVRVTEGGYRDGEEALPNVPEMYINDVSSKESSDVAKVLAGLKDDQTSKTDVAWSGKGTLDFRLDTAISLKNITLYLKDSAATSNTMKIYYSSNRQDWTEATCKVSNRRADGVTVRTFTPVATVSDTAFRVVFQKRVSLTELELNTVIPTFEVGSEAALSWLKAGGHTADAATLAKGWYGVAEESLTENDIKVSGKDNASVTLVPKAEDGAIRIWIESEDHRERACYQVLPGRGNAGNNNAEDDSLDYPYEKMTLTAASYHGDEPPAKANDGNNGTMWHSRWGNSGSGEKNLSDLPEQRYLQIELESVQEINALRYLPRSSDQNGIVLKYAIKVSTEALADDDAWMALDAVAEGSWSTAVEWKLANFTPVDAKYVRLYGVETSNNDGIAANEFMSAAEVRVRDAHDKKEELYDGNTTVTFADGVSEFDYNGKEIKPEPTVVYQASAGDITLTKGSDYELSYQNNKELGTAKVTVTGKGMYSGALEKEFTIRPVQETFTGYETVRVTTARGVYPELPGTIIANTTIGERLEEVSWDSVSNGMLNRIGTFTVYGTVAEKNVQVTAEVTVSDVIGVRQVTAVTGKGTAPVLPEKVTVYYSNGDTEEREVVWNTAGVSFDQAGIVKVPGTVGKTSTEASVRVDETEGDANNTPVGTNLALNKNGKNASKSWPRTFAYVSAKNDPAHNATDGVKTFASDGTKSIWSDWENGQYHTNASAAVGADDHLPFVATAFGTQGSTNSSDQKKYKVNKVSIGFMEEDGSAANKVALPEEYKIEFYKADNGVIPASRLENATAEGCSNTKGWGTDNPIKAHDGWEEVQYIGTKPAVPAVDDFKHMVDVSFTPVDTTAIRITLTPKAQNWTGLEEFEVYYEPPYQLNNSYTVTAINVDGQNVLSRFDKVTKTLTLDQEESSITATADKNASVTVLKAVDGKAKVIFLPENGDTAKLEEYTVQFANGTGPSAKHAVYAESDLVDIDGGLAAAGEEVTFRGKAGYIFTEMPALIKSEDRTKTNIAITYKNGSYTFIMPDYPVTITGEPEAFAYTINTKIPVRYIGKPFDLPEEINITADGRTYDTEITWNEEDAAALKNASEIGMYTVTGLLAEPEGAGIAVTVPVSPAGIVYFLDNGASAFTEKGQIVADANNGSGRIKNADAGGTIVPDGEYSAHTGWGFLNSAADLDVNGSGDAYTTIRHFRAGKNGQTLSYRFDRMTAGTYRITAGFYDPWSQWAADMRHAKITVTDLAGKELAVKEDHHISGSKTEVSFDSVILEKAGPVLLNIAPKNTGNDSNDVMVSYIVIQSLSETKKDALKAAIDRAKDRNEADYTASSWAEMQSALRAAEETVLDWGVSQEQVNAAAIALRNAVDKLAEVHKSGLQKAIDRAKERNEVDYTASSWAAMQAKLAEAKAVAADRDAAQKDVDAATRALSQALRDLEEITGVNKNALNVVIRRAEKKNEIDYTPESWTEMQTALSAAKALAESEEAEQAEVNAAAIALREKIAELIRVDGEPEPTDKEGLQDAINRAEARQEENYDAESWAAMQAVLAAVQSVLNKTDATQAEVDEATYELSDALRELKQKKATNKNELKAAIERIEDYSENDYRTSTWARVQSALAEARRLDADENAGQADVDDAAHALQDAYGKLERLDKKGLLNAILRAKEKNEADYSAESWAKLLAELKKAEALAEDGDALQADVNEATFNLSESIRNLASDKNGLEAAIAEAEKRNPADYTKEGWAAFQKALAQVKAVLTKEGATIEEINNAKKALQEALKLLDTAKIGAVSKLPAKGELIDDGTLQYQVTVSDAKNGTVTVVKLLKQSKKIVIPATVGKNGYTFKVTEVNNQAFQNNKNITEVTFGEHIAKIGKKSFFKCKKLKKITFRGTKAPKAGSKAFSGIKKNAKVMILKKVFKKQLKKFKKTMKSAGKKIAYKKLKK